MEKIGLDYSKVVKNFVFVEREYVSLLETMEPIYEELERIKPKLVVFDSLASINYKIISDPFAENEEGDDRSGAGLSVVQVSEKVIPVRAKIGQLIRRDISEIIKTLKSLECVSFLISELSDEGKLSRDGHSDYLCDGIIVFETILLDTISRNIKIPKMRETKTIIGNKSFDINDNGLIIG